MITEKQARAWAKDFTAVECRCLIAELMSNDYPFLRSFALTKPDKFYIDDRVSIENKRKIYAVVERLAEIQRAWEE